MLVGWMGLCLANVVLVAPPASLSPKLTEDLAEIQVKIERMEKDANRLSKKDLELGLSEASQWIDEFAAEAQLSEDDPLVHGLRQRLGGVEKRASARPMKAKKEEMPASRISDQMREKFEALLKVEVDLQNVSFKRDVAPIIASRCLGCHNANRQAGEFDASSYALFVEQIMPGKPSQSHLLDLVTGKAQPRMPRGNAGFDAESVAIWTAWIEQGAKFDGPQKKDLITNYLIDADTKRRERIAQLSPEEVLELHQLAADRHMKIVKPNKPLAHFQTPNFSVRTTLSASDAEYIAVLGEAILEEVAPRLGMPKNVWPGGLALTVFGDRYDYVAFAKAIDNYSPEDHESGHVRLKPELGYIAMTSQSARQSLDLLVAEQVLSALYRTWGKGKMPDWAVHGAASIEAENWDPARAPSVREELKRAAIEMAQPGWKGSIFKGELPWVQTAPLATSLFAYLRAERKKDVVGWLRALADGKPAADAIQEVLGNTDEELRQAWYEWTVKKYGR
jgi:hypothetical protein